jgi:hypothetical protein
VDDTTSVDSVVIRFPVDSLDNNVYVNDSVYRFKNKNDNEISYTLPCSVDRLEIAIGAHNPYAQILYKGLAQNPLTIQVRRYGDTDDTFRVVSTSQKDTAMYILHLHKPVPFDSVVTLRWDRALTVINNPVNNGGFHFREFKWYANGVFVSYSQTLPDGYRGYTNVKPDSIYSVVLKTDHLSTNGTPSGTIITSCRSTASFFPVPIPVAAAIRVYPNPVAGGEIWVEISNDAAQGADIHIYSIDGRLLSIEKAVGHLTRIAMPYAAGTYIVRAAGQARVVLIMER